MITYMDGIKTIKYVVPGDLIYFQSYADGIIEEAVLALVVEAIPPPSKFHSSYWSFRILVCGGGLEMYFNDAGNYVGLQAHANAR